nr:reverse transcriptase [Hymenolepis microstoma]
MKADTPLDQMRLLTVETINVFTDGSYVENQAQVGAFEGDIEAIKIALGQLCCRDTKFTNAVILSNSQSAIQSIGSREPSKTTETHECEKLYQLLKEKYKIIDLQWIPEHCGIVGNERADTLAKKGTTILQAIDRSVSFYTMKTLIRREFKTSRSEKLKARTKEKQWTAALSNMADWPGLEAVAEFRLPGEASPQNRSICPVPM